MGGSEQSRERNSVCGGVKKQTKREGRGKGKAVMWAEGGVSVWFFYFFLRTPLKTLQISA